MHHLHVKRAFDPRSDCAGKAALHVPSAAVRATHAARMPRNHSDAATASAERAGGGVRPESYLCTISPKEMSPKCYQNVTRCHQMSRGVTSCHEVSRSVTECREVSQRFLNVTKCLRAVTKCHLSVTKMSRNVSKCHEMSQSVTKMSPICHEMSQHVTICHTAVTACHHRSQSITGSVCVCDMNWLAWGVKYVFHVFQTAGGSRVFT